MSTAITPGAYSFENFARFSSHARQSASRTCLASSTDSALRLTLVHSTQNSLLPGETDQSGVCFPPPIRTASMKNRQIVLVSRPQGEPTAENFRLAEAEIPRPGPNQ